MDLLETAKWPGRIVSGGWIGGAAGPIRRLSSQPVGLLAGWTQLRSTMWTSRPVGTMMRGRLVTPGWPAPFRCAQR